MNEVLEAITFCVLFSVWSFMGFCLLVLICDHFFKKED